MSAPITLLLVEDDAAEAALLRAGLRSAGVAVTVTHVETLGDAISALNGGTFDVCLLDLSLPDSAGMATVDTLAAARPDLPIIVLTGDDRPQTEDDAIRHGGQDFLTKAEARPGAILRAIRHAMERARLQADLRRSHARFRDFAEASADWFWEMDDGLRFTWFSDRLEAVTGIAPDALLGKRREDFASFRADDPAWRAYLSDARACRPIRNFEYTLDTPAGRRWFRVNGRPVFEGGAFRGYRGSATDVTDLKKAEAEADALRRVYQSVVQDQAELICRFRGDGVLTFGNVAFFRHLGLPAGEAVGHDLSLAVPDDLAAAFLKAARALKTTERLAQFEKPLPQAGGSPAWILWRVRRVSDPDSTAGAAEFQVVGTNVTLQREQAARLEAEKFRAERATEAKSRFLASMSHEIRTPMTGVLGMAELLLDTPLDDRQRDYVDNILHAGEALLTLVNDILDMAKIEAGRLEIERVDASLRAVVDGCVALLRPKAEDKGIALTLEWAAGDADWLRLDPTRVRQVLLNLLSNAVKFTDRGSVAVTVEAARRNGERGVKITVADSGVGLSAEAQARLFTDFAQADASTARRFGGTGLGLSISRRLMEMMGGTIGVTSEEGAGSRFWFWLPLVEAQGPRPAELPGGRRAEPGGARRRLSILLAEDNRTNRLLLTTFLGALGHHVDVAEDGARAVAALRAAPDAYDLVLMDVMMPVMDGVEAAAALRAQPQFRDLPIIAVTADAMTDRVASFRAAGMTDVVCKPIDRTELLRAMDRALGETIHAAPLRA